MQITGKEFNEFMNDDHYWGDKVLEEWALTIDNKGYSSDYDSIDLSDLDSEARVSVIHGYVMGIESEDKPIDLKKFFETWKEKQTHVFFTVKVPKEHFSSVKKAVQQNGGKIIL